jgi:general stress protein 26
MKNPTETIGNLIDKQGVSFISSVDENGYPNTKAMLPPAKREGIKIYTSPWIIPIMFYSH